MGSAPIWHWLTVLIVVGIPVVLVALLARRIVKERRRRRGLQ